HQTEGTGVVHREPELRGGGPWRDHGTEPDGDEGDDDERRQSPSDHRHARIDPTPRSPAPVRLEHTTSRHDADSRRKNSSQQGRGQSVRHTRVVVTHYGGPDAIQVVEEERPEPKEGEVRVKVLAAGVS